MAARLLRSRSACAPCCASAALVGCLQAIGGIRHQAAQVPSSSSKAPGSKKPMQRQQARAGWQRTGARHALPAAHCGPRPSGRPAAPETRPWLRCCAGWHAAISDCLQACSWHRRQNGCGQAAAAGRAGGGGRQGRPMGRRMLPRALAGDVEQAERTRRHKQALQRATALEASCTERRRQCRGSKRTWVACSSC